MENRELLQKAHEAGLKAGDVAKVDAMIVRGGGKDYFVPDGVCGFASVVVKPGNSSFARFVRAEKRAYKHYYGGVAIPCREFNQSLQRKEAYCNAFAAVLKEAGIRAYVDSRLD